MPRFLHRRRFLVIVPLLLVTLLLAPTFPVSAHEAYVLTAYQFHQGLQIYAKHPLAPLFDPGYFPITILITVYVMWLYALAILFAATPWATFLDKQIKKLSKFGPLVIRISVGIAFFYAAQANVILGPELPLIGVYGGMIIRYLLFVTSFMLVFGVFTEVAALIDLLLLVYITTYFGQYMITYANYFAEFVVLMMFGARTWTVDAWAFGKTHWIIGAERLKQYQTPFVRIFYGLALAYAGYNIKFVHQNLSILVYDQYHLQYFFHASASYIAAGAGLSEILIGVFIMIGLAQRLTVLISLIFITLSLLYFKEMLWPHLVLYGISVNLIINSADDWTLDHLLTLWIRRTSDRLFRSKKAAVVPSELP